MKDDMKTFSPLFYLLVGMIISALIGMAISQLLLGRTEQYREHMLWKYTLLFYLLAFVYISWIYNTEKYLPILTNLLKFVVRMIVLAFPFFAALLFTEAVSMYAILVILPAQLIFLPSVFIFHVSCELNPELEKSIYQFSFIVRVLLPIVIVIFVSSLLGLPYPIVLSLGSLVLLIHSLLSLNQAIRKLREDEVPDT